MFSRNNDFTRLGLLTPMLARAGCFAPKWTPILRRRAVSNFNPGDFTECAICAPYSEEYRFCNSDAWRRADMDEWAEIGHPAPRSILFAGQLQIDAEASFNLPIPGYDGVFLISIQKTFALSALRIRAWRGLS